MQQTLVRSSLLESLRARCRTLVTSNGRILSGVGVYNYSGLMPGDGVGPEITDATCRVVEALDVGITWDVQEAGMHVFEKTGELLPQSVIDSLRRNKVGIKGPITTPVGTGFRSLNVTLRKELTCYANLRPCKSYAGVQTRFDEIDIVVVRENLEDLYAGIEFEEGAGNALELIHFIRAHHGSQIPTDSGITIKPISVEGSRRIVKFAFEYARANGRKAVTAIHKANIQKHSDGLFLRVAREVAEDYPDIEFWDMIVDATCMQLVRRPEQFDVMVMPNLYGDILSDLCAGLVGGLGVAPGANIGDQMALFEPIHGSAPKYTGQNKVNPMAQMFSAVMMLRHIGEREAAERMETALADVIAEGKHVTYDMKPDRNDPTASRHVRRCGRPHRAFALVGDALQTRTIAASHTAVLAPLGLKECRGRVGEILAWVGGCAGQGLREFS